MQQVMRTPDRIIASIGDLPASPVIVSSQMGLTADINSNIQVIGHTIMADQSLTARVLKLANSSFYGRSKEVHNLHEAIVLLGFKTLRSLVVATSTHSLYQHVTDERFRTRLWEHTLAVAIGSRTIAAVVACSQTEEAFLAGLMHDIGKLVLMQKLPREYGQVTATVERDAGSFHQVETAQFGFNHAEVGRLLLERWTFPPVLSETVAAHHRPMAAAESEPLIDVIRLANALAKHLKVGFDDERVDDLALLPVAARLGINVDQLAQIYSRIEKQYQSDRQLFSAGA